MNLFPPPSPPLAFLMRDLIVWGGISRGGWVSKGFELRVPDLSYASPEVLHDLQDALRIQLRALLLYERLQLQLRCDGDFNDKLPPYAEDTKQVTNAWVRRVRAERLERYTAQWRSGKLRRLRAFVFRGRRVDFSICGWSRSRIEAELSSALDQLCAEFAQWASGAGNLLRPFGIELHPLTDEGHFQLHRHTFNPSSNDPFSDVARSFDPHRPLIPNCWSSEAVGHRDTGFVHDGFEHGLLAMWRPPQSTRPGIVALLAQQSFRHFTITKTIEPIEIEAVIRQAEESFRRVEADLARERRVGDEAVLEKKRTKAKALREGFLRPFKFRFVVHVWAPDRAELNPRLLALKQSFQAMAGAEWFEPNLPTTCRKLWEQTWPGWVGSSYPHFKLYAEDSWLADLI